MCNYYHHIKIVNIEDGNNQIKNPYILFYDNYPEMIEENDLVNMGFGC